MAFIDLPPELILPILQLLAPDDLLRMRLLCTQIDNINRFILRHVPFLFSNTDIGLWASDPSIISDPNPEDENTFATLMTDELVAQILLEHVVEAATVPRGQAFGETGLIRSIQLFCAGFMPMTGQQEGMMQGATKDAEEKFRTLWMVPCMTVIGWRGRQWVIDELIHPGTHSDIDFGASPNNLLIAVSHHLYSDLKTLLQNGESPDSEHDVFGPPMYAAAYWDNPTAIQLLVSHGGKVGTNDGYHHSPLKVAAYRGSSHALSALLTAGADIRPTGNLPLEPYGSPLGAAAAKGHVEIVRSLLASKRSLFDTSFSDNRSREPLWWAVRGGHEEIVHLLVENRATVDSSYDLHGTSALHEAMYSRRHSIARFLLSLLTVDVNSISSSSRNVAPLHYAVREGDEELIRILIGRADLNPNTIDFGCTALYFAVERQVNNIVKLLLQRNDVDPNFPTMGQRTPLQRAVKDGNAEAVKLLLARRDIDPNRGRSGVSGYQTPLGIAAKKKDERIMALLLKHPSIDPSVVPETQWY